MYSDGVLTDSSNSLTHHTLIFLGEGEINKLRGILGHPHASVCAACMYIHVVATAVLCNHIHDRSV